MTYTVYAGTSGNDVLDASAGGARDIAAFRPGAGQDTCIGGAGNDQFGGLGDGNVLYGNGGDDIFFAILNNKIGGLRDTIDGGSGTDTLNITISTYQLTGAVTAELGRLKSYIDAGDFTAHFVSDMLHVDMVGVEAANLRLDGTIRALADYAAPTGGRAIVTAGGTFFDANNDGVIGAGEQKQVIFNGAGKNVDLANQTWTIQFDTSAGDLDVSGFGTDDKILINADKFFASGYGAGVENGQHFATANAEILAGSGPSGIGGVYRVTAFAISAPAKALFVTQMLVNAGGYVAGTYAQQFAHWQAAPGLAGGSVLNSARFDFVHI